MRLRIAQGADAPAWLTARPIAHRGLHDKTRGIVENTIGAAVAAIEHGFSIECDLQLSGGGEAVVFHDFTLERLTAASGRVDRIAAADLARVELRSSAERIPSFAALLSRVAGRVPLICEIKSRFDGDIRLADRAMSLASGYDGPLAFKSFDPLVVAHLRAACAASGAARRPLGMVAEAHYEHPDYAMLSPAQKFALAQFLHYRETRPDFLSYAVDDLPRAVPFLLRSAAGLPVMAWTVRTPEQRRIAAEHADQMIFEGFLP